jgi:hypothetical protein
VLKSILNLDKYLDSGDATVTFQSSRPIDMDNSDAQFGQGAPEIKQSLVDLSVDQLPTVGNEKNFVVAGMLLNRLNTNAAELGDNSDQSPFLLAAQKNSFEDRLKTEFPDKYKQLKDNAKNLRLELCLPDNASLEKIAKQLYRLRQGEISRYSCRGA